ncbi:MAG: hypothetical protein RR298_06165, partial [Alistipes sp.]
TEVILELFLFLFLFCKSDFSELNEDLQGGNWGKKSRKEEINKFKTASKMNVVIHCFIKVKLNFHH